MGGWVVSYGKEDKIGYDRGCCLVILWVGRWSAMGKEIKMKVT